MSSRFPLAAMLGMALMVSPVTGVRPVVALDDSAVPPDIGMLPPTDFSIQNRPKGVRWLRFDSVVVNVGPGPFEVVGRPDGATDGTLAVTQLVADGSGGWTEVATAARMFYAGDGHDHWHVRDLQTWTIARVNDPANVLRRGAKTGFCFWDNYRYGSTAPAFYHPSTTSACDERTDGTVPMGLSVGWGDEYPSTIAFQYIDITGLPNGDYLVSLQADAGNEFVEADETNNSGWAMIRIARKGVTVLSSGTELPPP
ncbi:MAG TPA: lysyl oxidase family protein [Candidatus Limnocylindria bacterium]|nr:lysyl oxidase family protein [Candidatus Limnocylindria bacterium]